MSDDLPEKLANDLARSFGHLKVLAQYLQPATAILTSSIIERALEAALIAKMRPISNRLKERLFEGYGPFASFSSKIDVAYALSIISDDVFDDLKIIKEIRNEFAHPKTTIVHFEDEEISIIVRKFKGYSKDEGNGQVFVRKCTSSLEALGGNVDFLKPFMGLVQQSSSLPSLPEKSR